MWDEVIGSVSDELPKFNDKLLKEFRRKQISSGIDYMDDVYKQAVKVLSGTFQNVEYLGCRVLSPDEQVKLLANGQLSRDTVNVQRSEAVLVAFYFRHENEEFSVPLFIPYLHNEVLVTNDTEYTIENVIVQSVIVRTNERKGIIIKVMQSPLRFWRNIKYTIEDTDGNQYPNADIITVQAHYRSQSKSSRSEKTTIVLYLLAEYGFLGAMEMLYVSDKILGFVDHIPEMPSEEFTYFEIKNDIYLKVRKEAMSDDDVKCVVASILYIWKPYTKDAYFPNNPESLEVTKTGKNTVLSKAAYRMLLGAIIYDITNPGKMLLAGSHGESHLESLRMYLDRMSQVELERELHVPVEDIFHLFVLVFYNINGWLAGYKANDLFEKKLGGINLLYSGTVEKLFNAVYTLTRVSKKKSDSSAVKKALRLNPTVVMDSFHMTEGVKSKPAFYNDNILLSMLVKKVRPDQSRENGSSGKGEGKKKSNGNLIKSAEHKFSSTFSAIEGMWSYPSSNPGIAGDINPYAQIDQNGNFDKSRMPWYADIQPVDNYK